MDAYIEKYRDLRLNGIDSVKSFGLIAGHIAFSGTIEDLRKVHDYHLSDFLKEQIWEEQTNENNQVIKPKAN